MFSQGSSTSHLLFILFISFILFPLCNGPPLFLLITVKSLLSLFLGNYLPPPTKMAPLNGHHHGSCPQACLSTGQGISRKLHWSLIQRMTRSSDCEQCSYSRGRRGKDTAAITPLCATHSGHLLRSPCWVLLARDTLSSQICSMSTWVWDYVTTATGQYRAFEWIRKGKWCMRVSGCGLWEKGMLTLGHE